MRAAFHSWNLREQSVVAVSMGRREGGKEWGYAEEDEESSSVCWRRGSLAFSAPVWPIKLGRLMEDRVTVNRT